MQKNRHVSWQPRRAHRSELASQVLLLLRETGALQTFEEIPREEHCDLINVLAGMASRWVAVTMGQLGQGGGHHIANRHK